jgi:GT2 family glycosyltransferase
VSGPTLSVIIVSYEVRELLRRCLASVQRQDADHEVWVVDNHSSDGSADMVAAEFPDVHLVRSPRNLGFAAANNLVLREARGGILLLLNPDTELPDGALSELARVFARHPQAGCVGLALVNPDSTPQPWCFAFPGILNQFVEALGMHRVAARLGFGTPSIAPEPAGGEGAVAWVLGACFAISRAAYEQVGGLDETLFMYGEEPDWCWRARRAGFPTIGSTVVRVVHHGGASGEGQRGRLFVQSLESRLLFLRRHRGAWRATVSRELYTLGSLLRLTFWQGRALLEGGRRSPRTRDQLERFRAVLAWRFGAAP